MTQGTERLLAGRYRLVSVVGRGGMGTVWRARDEMLHRDVAVKEVLLQGAGGDSDRDERHERTLREARASARLNHPGVVTVHDVVDEDDRPWIVMELVAARSLQDVVTEDGPLPPPRVAEIGRQVVRALRAAHAIGILHRDVKPANVLIAADGRAVLTDFGIAQISGDTTLTAVGGLLGSPAYMSPERLNGERATPASDLWALGATLYTAVEGRSPYARADAMAVIAAVLADRGAPPRNAGPLAPVIAALLTKDPTQRMNGARAETALAEIAAGRQAPGAPAAETFAPAAFTTPAPSPHEAMAWAGTAQGGGAQGGGAQGEASRAGLAQEGVTQGGGPQADTVHGGVRRRGRGARRALLIGGAVALVAAAVLTAGFVALDDGDGGGKTAARESGTPTATTPTATTPTVTASASASPSGTATSPAGEAPVPLTSVALHGQRLKVPVGWRQWRKGNSTFWSDPVTKAYVQFDTTPWTGDPRRHHREWAGLVVSKNELPGFRSLDLRDVEINGERRAADLEYTWGRDRVMHAVNRGMVTGTGPISVVVAVPESRWNDYRKTVNNVLDSLRV
ncbi:serine/threonine-protein kinase [Spirillospora sp. NPDC047279]|uniref:serine/threonine-protein kinase n=1 Tax=Spirillospora sp. NPDC047279 TaxID=3155478 RepID=UPI0033C5A156